MKLLADESVDFPIVERLRRDGHDVESIAEDSPGISDNLVLARAFRDNSILLTADKDFGELVFRERQPHAGVVLLRLDGSTEDAKSDIVSHTLDKHADELAGAFAVIEAGFLRIRRPPT